MHVAITRGREKVILTYVMQRPVSNGMRDAYRSKFLEDLRDIAVTKDRTRASA